MKNMSATDISTMITRFWILISLCVVCYGSSLIHIGLTWIFLGLYIFRFTLSDSGLINIFVNIPSLSELQDMEDNDEDEDEYEEDEEDVGKSN
jgi:hypothetical protein